MNEFVNNILLRHLDPVTNIIPRLPGKFEPVNFPSANTVDLSTTVETVQEVSLPQKKNQVDKGYSFETNVNDVIPLTPQLPVKSGNHFVQQLHSDEPAPLQNEVKSTGNKTISTPGQEFAADKKNEHEISFEKLKDQEKPVDNGIKPVTVNTSIERPSIDLFNEKPAIENAEQQGVPGNFLLNKPFDIVVPADKEGTLHQHISILKQRIVKASAEKKNSFSEDKKTIQAGLVKPVINNQHVRTNMNASIVSNEQPVSSVVKVSIGRIEVRAVTNAAPPKVNRSVIQKPNLTLDEYLKRKN